MVQDASENGDDNKYLCQGHVPEKYISRNLSVTRF